MQRPPAAFPGPHAARLPVVLALLAPVLTGCSGPIVLAGGRGAAPSPVAEAPPDRGGRLLVPGPMDAARGLPVVVFLPYTTGTADELLGQYERELARANGAPRGSPGFDALVRRLGAEEGGPGAFALLLVAGRGSAGDYASAEAWAQTIRRYEQQVFGDLALYAAAGLDTTRVVLVGHSLGGDLAWAIALRNPARVRGAVVMGSRASYRALPGDHRLLAERGVRFAFAMGSREDGARLAGARAAVRLLEQVGAAYRWLDVPDAGHTWAPLPVLGEALGFVLAPQ